MVKESLGKGGNPKRVPLKRGNSRGSNNIISNDKVSLEQVLGISASSNNSFSYDSNSGNVAYTAGCICVLYNVKRNKQTHIKNISKKPLTCVSFSRDGKLLATGESGHQPCVRVWDVSTGTQLSELQGHRFGISSVAFSPNSKVVVSVGFTHDSNVSVWNWKTGKQVAGNKVSSRVFGMSFNESGSYFVVVGVRFVKYWYFDTNNDKALTGLNPCENRAAVLEEHRNSTFKSVICGKDTFAHMTFCLSNDGRLFSFGASRRIERWLDLKVNDAFALYVTTEHLLCGCSDGVIRIFEPSTLSHIVNLPKPHPLGVDLSSCTSPSAMVSLLPASDFPDCIAVIADAITKKVITLYRDKSMYIWDISNIQRIGKFRSYIFHSACICAIEMYPQEFKEKLLLPRGTFFTGSSDNTIKIWNLASTDLEEYNIKRNIYSKELLNQIYTDYKFGWLRTKKASAISDNANGVTALAIDPAGTIIASGDKSGNLRVHDLLDLRCHELAVIEAHDAEILSLSFTKPTSVWNFLASASRDRLIHIFDMVNDFALLQTISDHSAIVTAVQFVERETDTQLYMLTSSADKSIRFRTAFKTSDSQLQFSTYQHVQAKSTLNDMDITPSKSLVTTGCQDRFIRTYDIASGKCVGSFKSGGSEDSGMIVNVTLDPSGSYVAAAGSDKCIFIHDFITGEKVASLYGHSEMITGMTFTNDCKRLVSISGDGCIFVWRLSNDVVKSIKNKMRGQGFEPEISADTPNANRKIEGFSMDLSTSPNNQYLTALSEISKSTPHLARNKDDNEKEKEDLSSFSTVSEIQGSPNSTTPDNHQRKKWGKPTDLKIFADLPPPSSDSNTPSFTSSGGVTPRAINLDFQNNEKDKNNVPGKRSAPDGGEETPLKTALVDDTDDDDDSQEDANPQPDEVIYAPSKILSPSTVNNKRYSHIFDVNVTPAKKGDEEDDATDDVSDNDVSNTIVEDDVDEEAEEMVKSDSFIKNKFTELPDEQVFSPTEDETAEEHAANGTISPRSAKLRQSLSRRFHKSRTPENKTISDQSFETPKSKVSSPGATPPQSPKKLITSDTDSTASSKYMSLHSKTTSSKDTFTDKSTHEKSEKTKSKFRLGIGKNKDSNKASKKKDEKHEKSLIKKSKSKGSLLSNKENIQTTLADFSANLNTILSYYDTLTSSSSKTSTSDDEISGIQKTLSETMTVIRTRLPSMSSQNNTTDSEQHAKQCAELCARQIYRLVEEKLNSTSTS